MTMKWYFFRWLRGPANIATGIVQTLTGGVYEPLWSFRAEVKFLDVAEQEAVHNAADKGRA